MNPGLKLFTARIFFLFYFLESYKAKDNQRRTQRILTDFYLSYFLLMSISFF